MRTKALILGAMPPVEGPTVSLEEVAAWDVEIVTMPVGVDISKSLKIHVGYPDNTLALLPPGELRITGALSAKVTLDKMNEDFVVSISVVEADDDN